MTSMPTEDLPTVPAVPAVPDPAVAAQRLHAVKTIAKYLTGDTLNLMLFETSGPVLAAYLSLRAALGLARPITASEAAGFIDRMLAPENVNPHDFSGAARALQRDIHATALASGWWDNPPEAGTSIALMHSELSEGLEALRNGNRTDDHLPQFAGIEAELADVIIRILDFSEAHSLRTIEAVVAKAAYNKTRPKKHGGKLF